ncbi:aldo/keto reductase [Paenibacillus sp. WLX1005]|uniref:aldo/keto reductase n=1 Tax=Paenibacillus sp. WLX1005 TaxID=3243766 RepID=UPI0039843AB7
MTNVTVAGIPISPLIIGTGDLSRMDGTWALDEFVAAGGTTIDMAYQYTGSEEIIGRWMNEQGNRQQLVLLSKCCHPLKGDPTPRVTPDNITHDLLISLERLRTDHIDLYALHRDNADVPVEPIIDTLNEHLQAGRIRALGASNWSWQRIQEANEYAAANGLQGFRFNSPNLSLAVALEARWPGCVSADDDTVQWHTRTQLPLLSWSAQAGGFFSGAFSPEDRSNEEMVRVYYSESNWERYRRTVQLAEEHNVTPTQIALYFVLHRPFPTAAIIGPRSSDELAQSLDVLTLNISDDELQWINLEKEERA